MVGMGKGFCSDQLYILFPLTILSLKRKPNGNLREFLLSVHADCVILNSNRIFLSSLVSFVCLWFWDFMRGILNELKGIFPGLIDLGGFVFKVLNFQALVILQLFYGRFLYLNLCSMLTEAFSADGPLKWSFAEYYVFI